MNKKKLIKTTKKLRPEKKDNNKEQNIIKGYLPEV
jgi:hypothetical protein